MDAIILALTPYLIQLLVAGLTIAVAWAAKQFASTQAAIKTKTGLDVEAILRAALHQALDTGVKAAVTANPGAASGDIIQSAVNYAKASVPGAIAKLTAPDGILISIAKAKLQQVIAGALK